MKLRFGTKPTHLLFLAIAAATLLPSASAATCQTESQMSPEQRDALSNAAHSIAGDVQTGNVSALQTNTIPAVAADFGGIAVSVNGLHPLVQRATITVDDLYALDASTEPAGSQHTDFYCGSPVVTLNFTNLPPGRYALAIIRATGVPQPQQLALILSETGGDNHWMLAGFFTRPMIEAGHDGLWYWTHARQYAQNKMKWGAWLYYQAAAQLLSPAQFLSSPNYEKLQREMDQVRPADFPQGSPTMLNVRGSNFELMSVGTTTTFGGLDLEVHYTPSTAQLAQLHDPATARQQVIDVMAALLAAHPELRQAFRGIWMRVDQGNVSVFALDLPMNQIPFGTPTTTASASPVGY